ncbi:hypothetical protein [Balneola vulgaris]|uniref:hypothetical protein n=1 Tax=Balneola vulgaris TaxID=287535 RepID=UPI000370892B|nr:hypothetical protein [Balneola vulgaris]
MFRSGENLFDSIIEFIDKNENITLFCPYIKIDQLKQINTSKKITSIIVRWQVQDLCNGASDLDVYHYCNENNIYLFRNPRIHLKAFWNNRRSILFGSANLTNNGIGKNGSYNYELNDLKTNMNAHDICYLNHIIQTSHQISKNIYNTLEQLVRECSENKIPTYPETPRFDTFLSPFLLSQLPMTESVEVFFSNYSKLDLLTENELIYLCHDLALYDIPLNLGMYELKDLLKIHFNSHPFIQAFKYSIINSKNNSMNYGRVVRWIQDNTTSVPIPRSWEIKEKQIVNILYNWLCYLDEDFFQYVPGVRSQVIEYRPL